MLFSLFNLVARRSIAHWKLLLVVAFGVVVAAALTASTAIYSDAIRDLGLSYALRNVPKLQLDVQVLNSTQSVRPLEYNRRRQVVHSAMYGYAGRYLTGSVEYGKSSTFFPTAPSAPVSPDEQRPRGFFQYQEEIQSHVRVVDGTLALHTDPPADAGQAPTVSVVVGKETADKFGVHVGDSFDLHPFWHLEARPVTVVVAGIIEPIDLGEEYWFGKTDRFAVNDTTWRTYPFFVDQKTLTDTVGGYLSDMSTDYTTFFFVKLGAINSRVATQVDRGLRTADAVMRQQVERTSVETKLPDTITGFRTKLFFTRLPLFALIMQVVGIILYYIVMVSTMLVDRQAGEVALFKSRGAGTWQVMTVYAIEGSVIALLGLALGPSLAALIVKLLGPTPPFHQLSGGHLLDVYISDQAIALAGAGALLSLLALLWPAYRASRLSIVLYKQAISRPQRAPFFTRYYLDVFLLVVGGVLFYELRERGSLVTKQVFGDLKADPLLLVTPALFMLMIALLFLRLFPLLLRLAVRLLGGVSGPSILLGLWHIVRSPVHYTRLILLLILVTSLGMFAAGFRATLDRSYQDRASYEAGAPLRLFDIRQPVDTSGDVLTARVKDATGASTASAALRANSSYSARQFATTYADTLAVDPATFASVAYWRGDFAGRSLSGMSRTLAQNGVAEPAGIALPDGSRGLGVWVMTTSASAGYTFAVRLLDARGRVLDYALFSGQAQGQNTAPNPALNLQQQPSAGAWTFYAAPLDRPGIGFSNRPGPAPQQPLRFLGIYVRSRASQQPETISDFFSGLQVTPDANLRAGADGFAEATVVEDFSAAGRYETLDALTGKGTGDTFNRSDAQSHAGQPSAQLTWNRGRSDLGTHGVRLRDDGKPLMLFADASFLQETGLHTGSQVVMYIDRVNVAVRIAGSFTYFPGFAANGKSHLLLADLSRLQAAVVRTPGTGETGAPNEVWAAGSGISASPEAGLKRAGVSADRIYDLNAIRAAQQHDPLVAASWEGILFLSFSAILLLAALGFTVYSYLTAEGRTLEFAVLRTMGLSRTQIAGVVMFEQAFVVGSGLIAGTVLGLPLSRVMIGFMGINETGDKVVPPFVSSVSWGAAATAYAGMAVVLIAAVASLVLLYGRLSVAKALRMGEV